MSRFSILSNNKIFLIKNLGTFEIKSETIFFISSYGQKEYSLLSFNNRNLTFRSTEVDDDLTIYSSNQYRYYGSSYLNVHGSCYESLRVFFRDNLKACIDTIVKNQHINLNTKSLLSWYYDGDKFFNLIIDDRIIENLRLTVLNTSAHPLLVLSNKKEHVFIHNESSQVTMSPGNLEIVDHNTILHFCSSSFFLNLTEILIQKNYAQNTDTTG